VFVVVFFAVGGDAVGNREKAAGEKIVGALFVRIIGRQEAAARLRIFVTVS
jgi:hypothetical protein